MIYNIQLDGFVKQRVELGSLAVSITHMLWVLTPSSQIEQWLPPSCICLCTTPHKNQIELHVCTYINIGAVEPTHLRHHLTTLGGSGDYNPSPKLGICHVCHFSAFRTSRISMNFHTLIYEICFYILLCPKIY